MNDLGKVMSTMLEAVVSVTSVLRRLLGATIGMTDYMRFSDRASAWGGPFNGQTARQALFQELLQIFGRTRS